MLNKKNRLTSNSSFKATYFQKNVVSDEFFVLYAGKAKENKDTQTKFGFVVSKKVHKRAVIRNKIKRRLRESVWKYLAEVNPIFMSVIFIAKEKSSEATFCEILKSVYKLMDKMANKRF